MKLTDDRCAVCQQNLYDLEMGKHLHKCPLCRALICDSCFKKAQEEHENLCPSCGRDPNKKRK